MPNTKADRSRVSKQKWEISHVASKYHVSQKLVREAMKIAVTKKGKPSIARGNVEIALKKLIDALPQRL